MTKKRLDLRKVIAITICLAVSIVITSCGGNKPNDTVICGDRSYKFSIGTIICDDEKNSTTVQLFADAQAIKLNVSGTLSPDKLFQSIPVRMKIVVGDKTIECNTSGQFQNYRMGGTENGDLEYMVDGITFSFNTSEMPDKIIVYSNDENKSTVAFDGKTKEVVSTD